MDNVRVWVLFSLIFLNAFHGCEFPEASNPSEECKEYAELVCGRRLDCIHDAPDRAAYFAICTRSVTCIAERSYTLCIYDVRAALCSELFTETGQITLPMSCPGTNP